MMRLTRARAFGVGLLVMMAGVISVGGLVLVSGILLDSRGNFLRMLPPHPVEELDSVNLGSYNYYFAGVDGNEVYLAEYSNQFHLLKLNTVSLDTQHISLNYRGVDTVKFYSPRLKVRGSYFFMVDGAVPAIYRGNLSEGLGESLKNDSIYFREFVPMSSNSFAVKSLSGITGENVFGEVTTSSPYWKQSKDILVKQKDGVFCTDGVLAFNSDKQKLVYIYYYRNEFIVMDNEFNLEYKVKTIDTVSVARIVPAQISTDGSMMLASPDYVVNRMVQTDGRWILIQSDHLGKNEHETALKRSSVIDVYTLENGHYQLSFYVYHFRGKKKMDEFIVSGDRVMVRYGNVVQAFRMKPEYFSALSNAAPI